MYLPSLLNTVDVEYVLWATQFYYTQVDSSVLRVAEYHAVWRCIVHWYSEVAVLSGGAARELTAPLRLRLSSSAFGSERMSYPIR